MIKKRRRRRRTNKFDTTSWPEWFVATKALMASRGSHRIYIYIFPFTLAATKLKSNLFTYLPAAGELPYLRDVGFMYIYTCQCIRSNKGEKKKEWEIPMVPLYRKIKRMCPCFISLIQTHASCGEKKIEKMGGDVFFFIFCQGQDSKKKKIRARWEEGQRKYWKNFWINFYIKREGVNRWTTNDLIIFLFIFVNVYKKKFTYTYILSSSPSEKTTTA